MIKYFPMLIIITALFSDMNRSIETKLNSINQTIESIDIYLTSENIWLKSYSNFKLYLYIETELAKINLEILEKGESRKLINSRGILKKQLKLFGNISSPFEKLLHPSEVEEVEEIRNPFQIFSSLSHINQNIQHRDEYQSRIHDIELILEKLQKKKDFLIKRDDILNISNNYEEFGLLEKDIEFFQDASVVLKTTYEIYKQRVDEVNLKIKGEIINHSKTILAIFMIFLILIGFSFFLKFLIGRYMEDNQRVYMGNKAVNIITITILILVLTFTYIDNIDNLITILGFVSAGLAIAMKDGFMSIFAWFVIIFGGSVKSGDRIKVTMSGAEYVGDILDISLLRITLQEDVTLTTFEKNRRAGRVIFVPNNYIFTNLVVNYSHYTLRTVWDGIDIVITFDSNHKKAAHIMKDIAKNYASGYTDMTRKQLNRLRDRYNLRNANVEPRMLSFIDTYGIKLSVWYLTNAYATLTLRSNISIKIIDAFNKEDDIHIAYPTQTINMKEFKRQ